MNAAEEYFDYARWARDTASPRGLGRAERSVLVQLALRADRRGRCHPSVGKLADDAGYSEGATKRALSELEKLKLISSQRRGRRSSIRQLCPDAPMPAPPCPRGTPPLFDAALEPVVKPPTEPAVSPLEVSCDAFEVSGVPHRSTHEEGGVVVGARPPADEDGLSSGAVAALAPRLDEVIAILDEAPGLVLSRVAINKTLGAFPEATGHDHVLAAHRVVMLAHERPPARPEASWLLWGALLNQTRGERRDRCHEGRRRTAPPRKGMDPEVAELMASGGESLREWMREAGFGRGT